MIDDAGIALTNDKDWLSRLSLRKYYPTTGSEQLRGKRKIPLSQACVPDYIGQVFSRKRIKGRYWSNNITHRIGETVL